MKKATVAGLSAGLAVPALALGWIASGSGAAAAPIARFALGGYCSAFVGAEKKFPDDPVAAYDWVNGHHTILWPALRKSAAGIQGVFPGGRYPMMLRFARNDYALTDWECPAMDRVLLGVAERRPMPEKDEPTYPKVSVSREGRVTIDGEAIDANSLERVLADLKERVNVAELYRQDWQAAPHPTARHVLGLMVKLRFIIDLRPHDPR